MLNRNKSHLRAVQPQKTFSKKSTEDGLAGDPRQLIPDDEYEAQAIEYKVLPSFGGIEKIYLKYRVTMGPHQGVILWQVFQKYPRYSPKSFFYKACSVVLGRTPHRREKLNPRIFIGHLFLVKTRTVIKDEDGDCLLEFQRYSVVQKILKVTQANLLPITDNQLPSTNYRLPTLPSLSSRSKKESPSDIGHDQSSKLIDSLSHGLACETGERPLPSSNNSTKAHHEPS